MSDQIGFADPPKAGGTKNLRPALILSSRAISEFTIYFEHLFVGLADHSMPSALICPQDSAVRSLLNPLIELIHYPAYEIPFLWGTNFRILAQQLEKFNPTIIHCVSIQYANLARKLARLMDLPYILSVNSIQKKFTRMPISAKHLAKIIVPAATIGANLAKLRPDLADRIKQVNIGTFTEDSTKCFKTPGRLSTIVIACSLDNIAPLENFLNAIRHLAIDGYEFMLVIIGDGKEEMQLRRMLAELGLSPIVTLVPHVQPWRAVFTLADIFIQPQPCESFDTLLLEAMSVGAAVAAPKGGADDLIIDGKTAVVFDPGDELSIYSTIQQLLDKPELAKTLAAQAQQYLRENYTVTIMVEKIIETYHQAQEWKRS